MKKNQKAKVFLQYIWGVTQMSQMLLKSTDWVINVFEFFIT